MTFASALGSQIPPHHFSPLLRNLIYQEGKEEERNLSLALPVTAIGKALSLAGACEQAHCRQRCTGHCKPGHPTSAASLQADGQDELSLMVINGNWTLQRSCALGPGSSVNFSDVS